MVQVWNDQDQKDETLAMVIRTGNHTLVGSLLKTNSHKSEALADHVIFKVGLPRFESLLQPCPVCCDPVIVFSGGTQMATTDVEPELPDNEPEPPDNEHV